MRWDCGDVVERRKGAQQVVEEAGAPAGVGGHDVPEARGNGAEVRQFRCGEVFGVMDHWATSGCAAEVYLARHQGYDVSILQRDVL